MGEARNEIIPQATPEERLTHWRVPGPQADRVTTAWYLCHSQVFKGKSILSNDRSFLARTRHQRLCNILLCLITKETLAGRILSQMMKSLVRGISLLNGEGISLQSYLLHALVVAHEATTKMRFTHLRVPGPQADRGTTAGHTLAEACTIIQRATPKERLTH